MSQTMDSLEVEVQRVLLQDWDPIGVKDIPEAMAEYDMYVSDICRMLRAAQCADEIYRHLRWIESERMGLGGDEDHTRKVAEILASIPQTREK